MCASKTNVFIISPDHFGFTNETKREQIYKNNNNIKETKYNFACYAPLLCDRNEIRLNEQKEKETNTKFKHTVEFKFLYSYSFFYFKIQNEDGQVHVRDVGSYV